MDVDGWFPILPRRIAFSGAVWLTGIRAGIRGTEGLDGGIFHGGWRF